MKGTRIVQINAINVAWGNQDHVAPPLSLSLVSLSCWLHMYSMFVAGLLPKKIVLVHHRFKQFGALEKDVCTARYAF